MSQYVVIVNDDERERIVSCAPMDSIRHLGYFCAGLSPADEKEAAQILDTLKSEGTYTIRDKMLSPRWLTIDLYQRPGAHLSDAG